MTEQLSEETAEIEEWTEAEKELLIQKGLLFTQLLESHKFVCFINMNYDIIREEGTKMMYVVEVPDEEALRRAGSIARAQAEAAPKVQTASLADVQKFNK